MARDNVASKCLDYQSLAELYEGGKEFRAVGIKEGRERITDVTRIITWLKGDSTVGGSSTALLYMDQKFKQHHFFS